MIDVPLLHDIYVSTPSKIVMLVVDGLGGLPHPATRKSELETALLPNIDAAAGESALGLTIPVLPGITPGSGPGHLALFGYNPLRYVIGRGALEATGVNGVDFQEGDVVARGNFCTVDANDQLIDRRAGRIPTSLSELLCSELDRIEVDSIDIRVYPVKDYRFVLRMRGNDLSANLTEMDPQRTGIALQNVKALSPEARATADATNEFVRQARLMLMEEERANMVMLRGFSGMPHLPSMAHAYQLTPAAIAAYPMYRGLATILGMHVLATGETFRDEVRTLEERWDDHDFFFIHYKPADTAGEDGDFDEKVRVLEKLDEFIPRILDLKPDVFLIVGDHSTPSIMANHSWHPVPFLLKSRWTRSQGPPSFNERSCALGGIGTIRAVEVMSLALAHADKISKFGA